MQSILSFKRNSFLFSKNEKNILLKLLSYFKYEIPNGNGSYLFMLDLDRINFKWSPTMILNDNGIFGSWTWGDTNSVYIRPEKFSRSLYEKICDESFKHVKNEEDEIENIKTIYSKFKSRSLFNELNVDQELLNFILYLTECDGVVLSTIFHELYHKWQFNSSKICYIANFCLFSLIGYERAIKNKFSLEGDVRIYVDCEALHNSIQNFHNIFFQYLTNLKYILKYEDKYNKIKQKQVIFDENIIYKYESSKEEINLIKKNYSNLYNLFLELLDMIRLS